MIFKITTQKCPKYFSKVRRPQSTRSASRRWWYEHFLTMIAAKIMNNYEKMTKHYKNIDIFDIDCSENHEKCKKIQKMTKHDKNLDIFEYDCSENHEIMVVLMDLEAETLSESRSFYARPAQISFKSWFC